MIKKFLMVVFNVLFIMLAMVLRHVQLVWIVG